MYTSSVFILYFVSLHLAYCIDGNGCSYSTGHHIGYYSYITLYHRSGNEKTREKNISSLIRSVYGRKHNRYRTDNCVAAFERASLAWIIFSRSWFSRIHDIIYYSRSDISVFYRRCSSLLIWHSF